MAQTHTSCRRFLAFGLMSLGALELCLVSGFPGGFAGVAYGQARPSLFFQRDKGRSDDKDANERPQIVRPARPDDQQVRLNFVSATWDDILNKVAADCGATLVMDKVPHGRFSRTDLRKYSRSDAVRILNEELAAQEFRILEQGNFLVVIHLPSTRPDYRRTVMQHEPPGGQATAGSTNQATIGTPQRSVPQAAGQGTGVTRQAAQNGWAGANAGLVQQPGKLQPAADQRPVQGPRRNSVVQAGGYQAGPTSSEATQAAPPQSEIKAYKPQQKTARSLSSTIFSAFGERAEVVERGPEGLPAIRIYAAQPMSPDGSRPVLFTLGVDLAANELLVEGSGEQTDRIIRLLQRLDVAPKSENEATRMIATSKGATQVAKNVQAAVQRLVAQNAGQPEQPDAKNQINRKDENGNQLPDMIGGVRGEVTVEVLEDQGIIILKGNAADVDAVMAIVDKIEELSAETAASVHVHMLKHIDSSALAELLTDVYTKLKDAQGRTDRESATVSVVAVVRPNAVLVIASARDLQSSLDLIEELDKPVPANTSFAVFTLKYGIASQVQQMLTEFYDDRPGLGTRVTVVADIRTNSVVVLAQPNDLKEITAVVAKLDKSESGAVSQVQVFPLRHAAADDLAQTLNLVIQSVINPAQLGQGQLGQAVLGLGGGTSSTQLREARSAILEFLSAEDGNDRRIRSGILADIRINGDSRSNTLIVTAPRESMELINELVNQLDRPATNVAEIKHFSLRNADASSVVNLLNQLFGTTTTQTGGGGAGGQFGQQNQQIGIALAAAAEASSVVPLRFSVDVRTNSIVAIGTAEALGVVEALLFRLDEGDIRERKIKVIRLKNTPALDIAAAVQNFLRSQVQLLQQQTAGLQGQSLMSAFELVEREVIVQAEPNTNTVLVSASPRYYDEIVQMIEAIDEDLPQVVIQALLVEVALDNTDEFGIELGFQDPVLFRRSAVTTTGGTTTLSPGFAFNSSILGNSLTPGPFGGSGHPSRVGTQGLSNFALGRTNEDLGFGGLVLSAGSDSVNVLLRALSACRKVEVLSRPQIRTLHNQQARISVARNVPRINGFQVNLNGQATPLVQNEDAGIILVVVPKVGPDGKIQMVLSAERSQFDIAGGVVLFTDPTGAQIRSPIKDISRADATVTVADEQTIVLGGLITKSTDINERKVPWLGDLPVVGHAFRYDSEVTRRTELLIFLTPRIVKNNDYNEYLKQIEAARLHWTECDAEAIHGPIFAVPPELSPPLVEPGRFDPSMQPTSPPPPPAPAPDGIPTSRIERPSAVKQVAHEEPAAPPRQVPANTPQADAGRISLKPKPPTPRLRTGSQNKN